MPFPEWGHSYNALYVPLQRWSWHCALMPAGEVKADSRFDEAPSFDQRENKRMERKKQIEQDKADFVCLFRVDFDPRTAGTSSDFRHYSDFIRDVLRASRRDLCDGKVITRVLRNAVRDGRITPVIDRAWYGGRRVFKRYAPQHWPDNGSGYFAPSADAPTGRFTGPFAASMYAADLVMNYWLAKSSRPMGSGIDVGGSGVDWIGAVESVGEAAFDGAGAEDDSGRDADVGGSLFDDAKPFEYVSDLPDGEDFSLAKTPNDGEPGTWFTNAGSGQMRLYGNDGQPVVDFDFDHDHGQGVPHAHNWSISPLTGKNSRGAGVPFSILP